MSNFEEDLAHIMRLDSFLGGTAFVEAKALWFIRTNHAEIAQNARRLRALEQATKEVTEDGFPKYSGPAIIWIRQRADEIMREGTPEKAE